VAKRIGFSHIVRIIGTDENVVGTEYLDQRDELVSREDYSVDEHFPQIMRRRVRSPCVAVGARTPGMIDASGISAEISSTVHRQKL
jgi:hypothetical protein